MERNTTHKVGALTEVSVIKPKITQKQSATAHKKNIVTAARGGGITVIGRISEILISTAFAFVLARYLGADQYGLYRLTITIVSIIAAIALFGLSRGVTRYIPIALKEKNLKKVWGTIQIGLGIPFIISLFVMVVILFSAEFLAAYLFSKPDLAPMLRLGSLAIPLLVMGHSLAAIALGFKKIEYDIYIRNIAFNVIKFILAVIVIALGYGVLGVTFAFIVSMGVSVLVLFIFVNRLFTFNRPWRSAQRNSREIIKFSFPMFLSVLLNQFGRRLSLLVLASFGVFADVGIYSVMADLSLIASLGSTGLNKISNPIVSELHSNNNFEELKNYHQTITKWSFTLSLPILLTILIFPNTLLTIFGQEFSAGSIGLIIMTVGVLVSSTLGNSSILLAMSGHSKIFFYNSMLFLVLALILNFILIPKYFLIGAAIAGTFTILLVNTLRIIQVYHLLERILPFNWSFIKPAIAFIIAVIAGLGLRQVVFENYPLLQVICVTLIMWAIYVITLYLLKLSADERLILSKMFNRLNLPRLNKWFNL